MPGNEQLLGIEIRSSGVSIRGDFVKTTLKQTGPDFIRLDPYFKDNLAIKSGDRVEFGTLRAPRNFVTTLVSSNELTQRGSTTTEAAALIAGVNAFRRGFLTPLETEARDILERMINDWFLGAKGEMRDRYQRELELILD